MNFVISKWITTIIKKGVQAGLAVLAAHGAQSVGVQVDADTGMVTVQAFVLIEALRGLLKHKLGWKFL